MVEIKNISKHYGVSCAVDNASFKVNKGEIVGLLGKNGAGKTTLLDIITGYASPANGSVIIDGCDLRKRPKLAKRQMGYLPQHPPVYDEMTVKEYLTFACQLKQFPGKQIDAAIQLVLEKADIEDSAERLIGNLNKGLKRRIALAGALCGNPEILILDEPTIGLNPSETLEMRAIIKTLGRSYTVILSSQQMHEVADLCEKVIIMSNGKIVAEDNVNNIISVVNEKRRVKVRLKCTKQIGLQILGEIEHVDYVEYIGSKEINTCDFIVESINKDMRAAIFHAAANENITMLGLNGMSVTLEDIFSQLTSDNREAAI